MIVVTDKIYLAEVFEVASKKNPDKKFLNGKLKTSPYEFGYLTVGIRGFNPDSVDIKQAHNYILDVSQSWVDNSSGSKTCFTHITLVGCKDEIDGNSAVDE